MACSMGKVCFFEIDVSLHSRCDEYDDDNYNRERGEDN